MKHHWWVLELACGHVVERRVRWLPDPSGRPPRGYAAQHQGVPLTRLPDPPPFVLISGDPKAPALSAQIGAAAFLVKPCAPDEMSAAIERLMSVPSDDMFDDGPTTRLTPDDDSEDAPLNPLLSPG